MAWCMMVMWHSELAGLGGGQQVDDKGTGEASQEQCQGLMYLQRCTRMPRCLQQQQMTQCSSGREAARPPLFEH
ncbi:hypothetical protein E2C01_003467 [Portunus trituberculatus]|uniref:Secreted protein n=1 Tax=Portunus trituberculatus TaxID=210409 RepID=A0A5B7CQ83_PORTR|nr:hypothetical protein [Portunus trituberculatus]